MFVLMGANGNITSKAAKLLLQQGHKVRVIGRSATSLASLKQAGADIAIGDAQDAGFLTGAFKGAQAVYVMIPPSYGAPDMREYQSRFGVAIAEAVIKSGVKRVVHLSSIGAHLPSGTGPIAGLHEQEQRLNKIAGLDLLHLRPAYFMENHLHAVGLIAGFGVYPSMDKSDVPVAMVATQDIAVVVARELANPSKRGVLHLHAPKHYTFLEAAGILGSAIGKPDLKHVQADPAQAKAGMVQHGFSQNAADLFEEMALAMADGRIAKSFDTGPAEVVPMTLETFASVFKTAFDQMKKAA
jgi:uncharacterized protein YbjT (DUF2867 family)